MRAGNVYKALISTLIWSLGIFSGAGKRFEIMRKIKDLWLEGAIALEQISSPSSIETHI